MTGKFLETDWLRIALPRGAEGYVTAPMLSDQFPVEAATGVYRATQRVDVRSGFGIGWETMAHLEDGAEVEVTGRVQVGGPDWLRISGDSGAARA